MRFGSVCSGIEAASVAFGPLGWQAAWFSEIEPFPSAVLAHHYPTVPNLGDMTALPALIAGRLVEAPDVLCGGTPCQAFSVAGLRRSLDDARGNLSLVFCETANAIDDARDAPCVILWENVPGVLSTHDNAFGCFLAGLAGEDDPLEPPGPRPAAGRSSDLWRWDKLAKRHVASWANAGAVYGPRRAVAWRTLDAQYFGLAQRRRRVFVVASARTGFDPAAVLFEFDGVRRDTAPSREAGQGAAAGTLRSTQGGVDVDHAGSGQLIPSDRLCDCGHLESEHDGGASQPCRRCSCHNPRWLSAALAFGGNNTAGPIDVATACNAHGGPAGRLDFESETFVTTTHTLRGEGFDASEDGTGRGTPLVAFSCKDYGADAQTEQSPTLRAMGHDGSHANAGGQVAVVCETLYSKGFTHGDPHARSSETHPGTLLRTLLETVGAETFAQWGLGILASLQPTQILRQALHGSGFRPAAFSRSWVVHCALSRPEDRPEGVLQSLREARCEGCPPQGWRPSEQLAGQLGAYLSELSQPGAQAARFLRDMWSASEGFGILREALSAVQEVGQSSGNESQPAPGALRVRRLTAEECEFLQGFPRGYTLIPYRSKTAADGPRYKALGNSWAVPVVRWIGARIAAQL